MTPKYAGLCISMPFLVYLAVSKPLASTKLSLFPQLFEATFTVDSREAVQDMPSRVLCLLLNNRRFQYYIYEIELTL